PRRGPCRWQVRERNLHLRRLFVFPAATGRRQRRLPVVCKPCKRGELEAPFPSRSAAKGQCPTEGYASPSGPDFSAAHRWVLQFRRPGGKLVHMIYRGFLAGLVGICVSVPGRAQISRDAKYEILRTVIADQASARMALPFGDDGIEISDSGQINKDKLSRDLQKNGQSIETGKVVT